MQRAVLNWSAMRVAEATAEAVFGCASSHGSLWPTRTATSAFNTIKPQILKRPKKDANMGINRTSGKRVSASQKDFCHRTKQSGQYLQTMENRSLLSRLACF